MSRLNKPTASRLRRTVLGVSPAAAEQYLAQVEREFEAQVQELQQQVSDAKADRERLEAEIRRQQERLQTAHQAVTVLRSKLARERAGKAVLVARLMEQQALSEQERSSEPRYESARAAAGAWREHEALRELVEELYRAAHARGALPPGLEVRLPSPPRPAPAPEPDASPADDDRPDRSARWHTFLLGKAVGQTLTGADGLALAREGEIITDQIIAAVRQAGLLFELLLTMRLPRSGEDL